jgi:hypothetical protein
VLRRIAFSVVVALLGACAADRSGLAGRGQDDGGRDGGLDGSITRDAGFDGSIEGDAGVDGGSDAGTDTGVDSGTDSGTDAGVDSGTDAGVDSGTDAGVDSGTDSNEARCRARFGDAPGFEYCGSAEDRCEHYVRFAPPDNNCAGVCDRRGATCLGSFDNGAPNCMRSRPVDCGGNFIDRICICSLPD